MIDAPEFNFEAAGLHLGTGFDLVEICTLVRSVSIFGDRFKSRIFSPNELLYAEWGDYRWPERLAARFAAKEAVIKALNLSEAGVNWRDIEVVKMPDGACTLQLHGRVCAIASAMHVQQLSLSLSHDGGYAGAFVVALFGHMPEPY